jgi:murein DD-endopeptidase MepM/ murein hydrolase activator NlpD
MEPSKFLHLGIDFTAEVTHSVHSDQYMLVKQVYTDTPEESGWGTRILCALLEHPDIHLVYGHLAPRGHVDVGHFLKPGDIIGLIGGSDQNGGWSPHLHVQAIRGPVDEFLADPASLDGYGELADLEKLAYRFPDPMRFISLR